MNLIEKFGLEKCKQIVDGAPKGAELFNNFYIRNVHSEGYMDHFAQWNGCKWKQGSRHREFVDEAVDLDDLRTAIAKFECDHDWEDITCNGDLERQLICTYCSIKKSVPFELNAKQWADEDTDHCTDIRNHITPLTGVIER